MRNWVAMVAICAVGALGCGKDKPPEGAGAQAPSQPMAGEQGGAPSAAQIQATLMQEHPDKADMIRNVIIMREGDVVTLRGTVPDEQLQMQLVQRVRQMEGVREVRDEMQAGGAAGATGMTGTTGTTAQADTPRTQQIRVYMLQERPNEADVIRGITITEDGGIVTLRGKVYDERMKSDLARAAKTAPGVRDVREELQVDRGAKTGGRC